MRRIDDAIDFAAYHARTENAQRVRPASDWIEELQGQFFPTGEATRRALLPWRKTHQDFDFKPSEVTLWIGRNGEGKSLLQGQCITSLCAQGFKCAVASFEMRPERSLYRMARQTFCGLPPSQELVRQFSTWTDGRLWFYDSMGLVETETILGVLRYCADELGIEHFAIDSLSKCIRNEDDFNAQKNFIEAVTAIARDTKMHIHLVHHARKVNDDSGPPRKMDAKGSGSITDQVDNVLIVFRNKKKEKDALAGVTNDSPDALLICEKNRNGENEPTIAMWLDKASAQFVPYDGATPQDLTNFGSEITSSRKRIV